MAVKFQHLPKDCICGGKTMVPVGNVPGVGSLPELVTYRCPACGHVETVEENQPPPQAD